jgi:hypothetical protein
VKETHTFNVHVMVYHSLLINIREHSHISAPATLLGISDVAYRHSFQEPCEENRESTDLSLGVGVDICVYNGQIGHVMELM